MVPTVYEQFHKLSNPLYLVELFDFTSHEAMDSADVDTEYFAFSGLEEASIFRVQVSANAG